MALKFPCKILLFRDFRMQKIVPHYHQRWNKILALFRQKHTQKLQMKYFKIRRIMHQPFILHTYLLPRSKISDISTNPGTSVNTVTV